MICVATVNVNGIRAATRRGMGGWLAERRPDLLCLQEVRADDAALHDALGPGWCGVHEEAGSRGRAGVAVLARTAPLAARTGLARTGFDAECGAGRWVEADYPVVGSGTPLTVVSAYVFTGQAGTPRQDEKLAFLGAARRRLDEIAADGRPALLTGDVNIAHREQDLKNWKGNRGKAGFLPAERAWFDDLLAAGWVDVVRRAHREMPGPYSWWSWRGRAFDNDAGWRIDYQIATPALAALAGTTAVDRAPSYRLRWSDHAPVVVEYDLRLR